MDNQSIKFMTDKVGQIQDSIKKPVSPESVKQPSHLGTNDKVYNNYVSFLNQQITLRIEKYHKTREILLITENIKFAQKIMNARLERQRKQAEKKANPFRAMTRQADNLRRRRDREQVPFATNMMGVLLDKSTIAFAAKSALTLAITNTFLSGLDEIQEFALDVIIDKIEMSDVNNKEDAIDILMKTTIDAWSESADQYIESGGFDAEIIDKVKNYAADLYMDQFVTKNMKDEEVAQVREAFIAELVKEVHGSSFIDDVKNEMRDLFSKERLHQQVNHCMDLMDTHDNMLSIETSNASAEKKERFFKREMKRSAQLMSEKMVLNLGDELTKRAIAYDVSSIVERVGKKMGVPKQISTLAGSFVGSIADKIDKLFIDEHLEIVKEDDIQNRADAADSDMLRKMDKPVEPYTKMTGDRPFDNGAEQVQRTVSKWKSVEFGATNAVPA